MSRRCVLDREEDSDAHTLSERIVIEIEGRMFKIEMDRTPALTGNIIDTCDGFHFKKEIKLVRGVLKISVLKDICH